MYIENQWVLDNLNINSVSILKQQILIKDDGTKTPLGDSPRIAYINSPIERKAMLREVPSPYKEAILSVWGDCVTVDDPIINKDN